MSLVKLTRLSSNQKSFKTINFNPKGLTLIVGTSSGEENAGHSNGVGKSLALRLVHHCLGANGSKKLGDKLPEWVFRLDFEINGKPYQVERSADSKILALNQQSIKVRELQAWLNQIGVFNLSAEQKLPISFRSLVKRFARVEISDCIEPDSTAEEQPFEALVRTLFLVGLDVRLVSNKYELKKRIDSLRQAKKVWRDTPALHDLFRAGNDARIRADWLRGNLPRLQEQLNSLVVAENYHEIEKVANEKTQKLRDLNQEIEILKFRCNSIADLLIVKPDITSQELLSLYQGLEVIFKPEALRHFDVVEKFHRSVAEGRKRRLTADLIGIQSEILVKETERGKLAKDRDEIMQSLRGKTAFEEYRAVANEFAQQTQELKALEEFLEVDANIQKEELTIKEALLLDAQRAAEYLSSNPLSNLEIFYRRMTECLYPNSASGLSLENNTGENLLRYNFKVHLDGSKSDGIGHAKILCFDWLVFTHGANHTMQFLWHDNRLFAHLDPGVRGRWFSNICSELLSTEKQYIATINSENYDSMLCLLTDTEKNTLELSKVLELRGNMASQKLLGIQVDL